MKLKESCLDIASFIPQEVTDAKKNNLIYFETGRIISKKPGERQKYLVDDMKSESKIF